MATTSPDNIQYPVGTDQVAPLANHFKNLADSTQAALNTKPDTADLPDIITHLNAADYIKFDTTYTGGSTQPGMLNWNDTDGTLEFQLKGGNVTLQIGQEQVVRVKNDTGAALANGKAVYISGSNGTNLLASYANAGAENTSSQTIGITTEEIGSNQHGFVTTFGLVRNIDTNTLVEGAAVWLDTTNGGLTATRPAAPNHGVLLGFCLRKSATVGVVFVRVDNGWELDELHNVSINSGTLATGQALTYDASTQLWKNSTPVSSLAGLSDVQLGTLSANEVLKYNGTKWVNGTAAGGVTAQATAPDIATAKLGDAWFNTNDGTMYVCYIDADSTKQWVQVQANSALDASVVSRVGALESQAIALGTYSPNYIINGAFDINQRNFTSTTTFGYGFDRWFNSSSGGTATCSAQTFTPGTIVTGIGDAANYVRMVTSGQSGATDYAGIQQRIEDVRTLAGQTVTISFWARAASGTPKVGFTFEQSFGSGGTPSSNVITSIGSVTISSSWARYSYTTTVPSIAGKTIGTTANSSSLALELWTSMGSGLTAYSNIGVQNTQIDFWGIQLERGSTATAFRRNQPNIQAELAACQRYYFRAYAQGGYGYFGEGRFFASTAAQVSVILPVTMRVVPTSLDWSGDGNAFNLNYGNGGWTGVTGMALYTLTTTQRAGGINVSGSGWTTGNTFQFLGNNNSGAYVGFSAEL